jgi:hypothetical protein
MSSADLSTDAAARAAATTRRRHYEEIAQLLADYNGVLSELAQRIATGMDTPGGLPKGRLPWSLRVAVWRYRSVWEHARDAALIGSQILVRYQLDAPEAAVLRLRLADIENGIDLTGRLINTLREAHVEAGTPIPSNELDDLVHQIQSALKGVATH